MREFAYFCVVHAPHQSHGTHYVVKWWNDLSQRLKDLNIYLSCLIVMGDFNLSFGTHSSSAIGTHYKCKQITSAKALHKWMLDNDLFCLQRVRHIMMNPPLILILTLAVIRKSRYTVLTIS